MKDIENDDRDQRVTNCLHQMMRQIVMAQLIHRAETTRRICEFSIFIGMLMTCIDCYLYSRLHLAIVPVVFIVLDLLITFDHRSLNSLDLCTAQFGLALGRLRATIDPHYGQENMLWWPFYEPLLRRRAYSEIRGHIYQLLEEWESNPRIVV